MCCVKIGFQIHLSEGGGQEARGQEMTATTTLLEALHAFCRKEHMMVKDKLDDRHFITFSGWMQTVVDLNKNNQMSLQTFGVESQKLMDICMQKLGPESTALLRMGMCLYNGCDCPAPEIFAESYREKKDIVHEGYVINYSMGGPYRRV